MHIKGDEFIYLYYQIPKEKSRIESAIANGEVFENVKKMVLDLRELEKKLDDWVSRQKIREASHSNQTL